MTRQARRGMNISCVTIQDNGAVTRQPRRGHMDRHPETIRSPRNRNRGSKTNRSSGCANSARNTRPAPKISKKSKKCTVFLARNTWPASKISKISKILQTFLNRGAALLRVEILEFFGLHDAGSFALLAGWLADLASWLLYSLFVLLASWFAGWF